jgi:hypothetical protein
MLIVKDREEADAMVKQWFEEFEAQDEIRNQMLIKKQINPIFDWNNKYLGAFIIHCPVFKELFNTKTDYSIDILWQIKNYKLKLCKKTMEKVITSHKCSLCSRTGCKVIKRG